MEEFDLYEEGFDIEFKYIQKINEEEQSKFWYEFIGFIEEQKLLFGGGDDENGWQGFISFRDDEAYYDFKKTETSIINYLKNNLIVKKDFSLVATKNLQDILSKK